MYSLTSQCQYNIEILPSPTLCTTQPHFTLLQSRPVVEGWMDIDFLNVKSLIMCTLFKGLCVKCTGVLKPTEYPPPRPPYNLSFYKLMSYRPLGFIKILPIDLYNSKMYISTL